jgi:hypothetical protein
VKRYLQRGRRREIPKKSKTDGAQLPDLPPNPSDITTTSSLEDIPSALLDLGAAVAEEVDRARNGNLASIDEK